MLSLINLIPIKWKEIIALFQAIWTKLPTRKYGLGVQKVPESAKVKIMELFEFPSNGTECFYGLWKKWMPVPAWYILFPNLRYLLSNSFLRKTFLGRFSLYTLKAIGLT